jgi:N-acetylglucosamine kinase-like BadF-type ATPase
MQSDELVLGIDGGGSKTVAWLAPRSATGQPSITDHGTTDEHAHASEGMPPIVGRSTADEHAHASQRMPPIVGRGTAGAANPQAIGFDTAIENLDRAVAAAFEDAQIRPGPVAAAVLGLAGSDRDANRRVLQQWANNRRLAGRFRLVHDALPVLMAGSPDGWGVALIAGTGSMAFGQDRAGRTARAGGWGYLFGDEGSGYAIALAGLRAAAGAADGREPETLLLDALLDRLQLKEPPQLVTAVYRIAGDRAAIASLAEVVTQTADENDKVAQQIIDRAAADLAAMVAAVAEKLFATSDAFPLVLTGGVLLGSQELQSRLQAHVASRGLRLESIRCVPDPVAGAVRLAQSEASM